MPQSSDEQGLVALICNKKIEEMTNVGEKNIQQAIHKILGGQNNIQVLLDSKKNVIFYCRIDIFKTNIQCSSKDFRFITTFYNFNR